ncbi:MAG: hypothetical protein HYX62_06235 [Gammaproteobacteria bacterium]|nr:hypothetical protein [Gammaproteobacteria bacterium]
MHLILSHSPEVGGGFRSPLIAAHNAAMRTTKHVQAAVAYVSTRTNSLLADCAKLGIRCEIWSRHDESLPTALPVMQWFLGLPGNNLSWQLVSSHFHPKVIWWHGYGVYIGSANLTDAAWHANCEAGVVILESEIDAQELREPLVEFFAAVHSQSVQLTREIYQQAEALRAAHIEMEKLRKKLAADFAASEAGKLLSRKSLADSGGKAKGPSRRDEFLKEWQGTLTTLRKLQVQVAASRPRWVPPDAAPGIQVDQFLHAYYYRRVEYKVEEFHLKNRVNPQAAVDAAIDWWRNTATPPSSEGIIFQDWEPLHRRMLTPERLANLNEEEFVQVARRNHSINGYGKHRSPGEFGEFDKETDDRLDLELKLDLHCREVYHMRNLRDWNAPQLLHYLLFDSSPDQTPTRLYQCVYDPEYKMQHLSLSALGEFIGWGLPAYFPPRNDRTNKALRALGFDVKVRSPNRTT